MKWANSAFRHGVSKERSGYIVGAYPLAETVPLESNPAIDGLLYLGDDPQGVPLEVIAIPLQADEGDEAILIIHAMRLRRRYRERYEEIMREHWGCADGGNENAVGH